MKPGTLWPWVIGGALILHVVVSLAVVVFATSDASYAIEEDYYQKALDWDQKRAQDRTNDSLGWVLEFEAAPPTKPGDQPKLVVSLSDRAEQALNGASVSLVAFHKASSDEVIRTVLDPTGEPGKYTVSPPMRRNGLWELRFTVTRSDGIFTHNETRHLFVEGGWR